MTHGSLKQNLLSCKRLYPVFGYEALLKPTFVQDAFYSINISAIDKQVDIARLASEWIAVCCLGQDGTFHNRIRDTVRLK